MNLLLNPNLVVRRRWIFLAFLTVLHLIFMQGPQTDLGRLLLLPHIGIGLLWQPFVQPRRGLGLPGSVFVILSATVFAFFLDWWVLLVWIMMLIGIVGGKVFMFHDRWERMFYLVALGYLVTMLLALVLPHAVQGLNLADAGTVHLVLYLSPVILPVMAALPVGGGVVEDRPEIVDYIYGVFVFLLLAVIVLGSLSFALLFKTGYFESLLVTLACMGGILLLLGLIWDPHAGFGGLGSAVAQHIMSLGLPIEDWLASLAELAKHEADPERFLSLACSELPSRMPGVLGGVWRVAGMTGSFGHQEGVPIEFLHGRLELRLMLRDTPTPSLRWHYDLMVRLLAETHLGKWRAQELQRLSYIEAVHETGARLTHDVKNLLQSMEVLCAAAKNEDAQPTERVVTLFRRQLPEISARLRQTLAKLNAPATEISDMQAMLVSTWLASIQIRYAMPWVTYVTEQGMDNGLIPDGAVFASVLENLMQNAIDKRRNEPGIHVQVGLRSLNGRLSMDFTDTGSSLPALLASQLFKQRVLSENGFGIGLYQCARMAESIGYRLSLAENREGAVRFSLVSGELLA